MSYISLRIESFAQNRANQLPLDLCQQCGALIGNTAWHEQWHEEIAAIQ